MKPRSMVSFLVVALSLFLVCGGSSEQGNCRHITGHVTTSEGNRTCELALVPEDHNPYADGDDNIIYTESDSAGNYLFEDVETGDYFLNAYEPKTRQRLLRGPITVEENDIPLGTDTVSPTSYIIADIAAGESETIVGVYIRGTTAFVSNVNNHRTLAIPAVPSGSVDIVSVVKEADRSEAITRPYLKNIIIDAADTIGVTYNNRPPVITAMPSQFISNDENGNTFSDTIYATDPENDPLSYTIVNGPKGMSINESNGALSWQVPLNNATVETFAITVKVADDDGAFTTGTLNIISEPVETVTPTPVFAFGDTLLITTSSIGTYQLEKFNCSASQTQYRFAFSNGDTSAWSVEYNIEYKWDPSEEKNHVAAQMYCEDYSHPSEWTGNFYVYIVPDTQNMTIPPFIEGPETCIVDETYHFLPISDQCGDDSTQFVIHWGDGDSTSYTPDYSVDTTHMVSHTWKDTGSFTISLAVVCSKYPVLSGYAKSLTVTVYEDSSQLPTPPIVLKAPLVTSRYFDVYDTFFIQADTAICEGALYQFFYNDTAISDRSPLPEALYIPTIPGVYLFAYTVWCEDDTINPCCISESSATPIKAFPDTCDLRIELYIDSTNNSEEYIIEAAIRRDHCPTAFTTCTYRYILDYSHNETAVSDTTEWMIPSDTKFVVPAQPGIIVRVHAQSRCGNEDELIWETDWYSQEINFP